jgi:3-methyladenine DNA glycosylase Tag
MLKVSFGFILLIMYFTVSLDFSRGGPCWEPILNLKWDYRNSLGRFDPLKVAKQINGHYTRDLVIEEI